MTTTENYIYRFEAALDTGARTNNADALVRSLGLTLPKADPKWGALIETVKHNQALGLNYNRAHASLAVLCQEVLAPLPSPINYLSAETQYDHLNISTSFPSETAKRVFCLSGRVLENVFHRYRPIQSNPAEEFPEAFGNILREYGLAKELADVRVRNRLCHDLSTRQNLRCRVLLEFYDTQKAVSWWCVGIGPGYLTATTQAAFDGYRFALDPRRAEIAGKGLVFSGKTLG